MRIYQKSYEFSSLQLHSKYVIIQTLKGEITIKKIDKRRHYILMLDTETANCFTETVVNKNGVKRQELNTRFALFYDLGFQVIDTKGNVYESGSYVNRDIFYDMRDLMHSAYYAYKIPQYELDLASGARKLSTTYGLKVIIANLCRKYNIKEVCAHNAYFDLNTLNTTIRYIFKSKYRYFLPYGITMWDTLKMARDTIGKQKGYIKFCEKHGYLTKLGRPQHTAEVLYRYITKDPDFKESHTGLEDVKIESVILWHCLRQHKKMRKKLFDGGDKK